MSIPGFATSLGTQHYQQRYQHCAPTHFRAANELVFSSLGVGTYLGTPDSETDQLVADAVIQSVTHGINLIDTAINYRFMHAEWSVREALNHLFSEVGIAREELIICTKGGFIPNPDRAGWFRKKYVESNQFSISMDDLAVQSHCLHPEYLEDQLERSLKNLNLDTIDIYYIHNPENELTEIAPNVFYQRLEAAFRVMEKAVKAGKIRAYGLATWDGFRVPSTVSSHLDLAKIKALASSVAESGSDRLQFIQLPFNAAMPEAFTQPTQYVDSKQVTVLEAAQLLGIHAIASASIGQTQAIGKLPASVQSQLGQVTLTEAQQALQFTRSCPGFVSALVGMKTPAYVADNLALVKLDIIAED